MLRDRIRDVAEAVLNEAVQKGLMAGSRLPTERELSEGRRLSRSTVRNAMARCEANGVVSRGVGRGTYLRQDPRSNGGAGSNRATLKLPDVDAASLLRDVGPADVMAAPTHRTAAMYMAVTEATEEDFEEMERCLKGREAASTYDDFERCDLAFHRCLIMASRNALLIRMYSLEELVRQGELWGNLKRRGDSENRREHYRGQHREIVVALRNRDGRAAHHAIIEHLDNVEEYLDWSARS